MTWSVLNIFGIDEYSFEWFFVYLCWHVVVHCLLTVDAPIYRRSIGMGRCGSVYIRVSAQKGAIH